MLSMLLIFILLIISITDSLFHSRLETFLISKSFPPKPSFSSSGLTRFCPGLFIDTSEHIRFYRLVFCFPTIYLFVVSVR